MVAAALKSLPVGTAYAVWVEIGAVGVATGGIVALGESASVLRLASLAAEAEVQRAMRAGVVWSA